MKNPANIDVAVLILFFNRPESLKLVFDEVRKARPSKLFLYQDGPRNENDLVGIEACRKIVSDIDWDCEVHEKYQTINEGCDPSNYNAQKWAFSIVDKCIVFEDDSIPSVSFFRFCKELLDKYENDERISIISGFNPEEITSDVPYDYFFTSTFSIWGWASWKRVIDKWDEQHSFLDDKFNMHQLQALIKQRKYLKDFVYACKCHRETGRAYYETIFLSTMLLNSGLSIVPTHNMINNLGPIGDSTHYNTSLKTMPRGYRSIFTMKRYELTGVIKHPRYVIENVEYKNSYFKIMGWRHPWIKIGRSLEELILNIRYGNFKKITGSISNRIKKCTGRDKHI